MLGNPLFSACYGSNMVHRDVLSMFEAQIVTLGGTMNAVILSLPSSDLSQPPKVRVGGGWLICGNPLF